MISTHLGSCQDMHRFDIESSHNSVACSRFGSEHMLLTPKNIESCECQRKELSDYHRLSEKMDDNRSCATNYLYY